MLRKIVGEYMLIPTGEAAQNFNGMISLNETAHFIWENVEGVGSFQELIELIEATYEVDMEKAAEDAAGILNTMIATKVISFTDKEQNW